jgi:hypothetical protein
MGKYTQDHDTTNSQGSSYSKSDSDDFAHFEVAITASPGCSIRARKSGM